jgi:hypothetical protein
VTALTIADIADLPTVDVPTAGQVLGIGRDASYAAAARGEIPTLRLGRSLRVPVPKLLELLGASSPTDSEAGELSPGTRSTSAATQKVNLNDHRPATRSQQGPVTTNARPG